MTEEETKEKWCSAAVGKCVASKCMAWRWLPFMANDPAYIAALKVCENDKDMKPPQAAKYVNDNRSEFGLPTEPFDGYCGLAGKP